MTICDPQNKTSSKYPAFNATAWVAPTAVLFCALDYCSSQLFSIHLHIRGEETGGNSEKPKLIKVIAVTTLSCGRFLLAFLLFEVGRQQDFSAPQLWLLLQGCFFSQSKGKLERNRFFDRSEAWGRPVLSPAHIWVHSDVCPLKGVWLLILRAAGRIGEVLLQRWWGTH